MSDERPNVLPIIGDVKGFFEVFLPGLFLLLHLALLFYCLPFGPAAHFLSWLLSSGLGAAAIIGLPLGYVLGLALRLGRTSFADRMSVPLARRWTALKRMHESAAAWLQRQDETQSNFLELLSDENLPYPLLMMARVARLLPPEALRFYKTVWLSRVEVENNGSQMLRPEIGLFRFNFLKTLVASVDEQAAKNMFTAEMMVRHSAHMCAALLIAALTMFASSLAIAFALWKQCVPSIATWGLLGVLILGGFLESIILFVGLLPNLRLLRVSEAELVFTCCFRNRNALEKLIKYGKLDGERTNSRSPRILGRPTR